MDEIEPANFVAWLGRPECRDLCRHVCDIVLHNYVPDGTRREGNLQVPLRFTPLMVLDADSVQGRAAALDGHMAVVPFAITSTFEHTELAVRTFRVFRGRPPVTMVTATVNERVDIHFHATDARMEITVATASPIN